MLWGQKTTSGPSPCEHAFASGGRSVRVLGRFGAILAAIWVAAALPSSSAALAQTAGSSNASQAQAAPMTDADKRIAADLLFKRLLVKPDDLDAGFRYAELETELGDYEAAIGALERMLYYNPNLPRVKLQLGVLYFHLRSYEMARNYFESVLAAPNVPSDIQTEVQTYVAAVDKAVAINQFSVYGQFGLAYQTNANAGPNSPNVLALGQNALLSPQFQKTPDWNAFGLVTAHDFYDFNDQRGDGWESDVIAYYSQQFRVTRLDLGSRRIAHRAADRHRRLRRPQHPPIRSRQRVDARGRELSQYGRRRPVLELASQRDAYDHARSRISQPLVL